MFVRSAVALAAIALPAFAASLYRQNPVKIYDDEDDCPKAWVLCIRGTTEKPGCGEIGKVADAVAEAIPGTEIHALNYPADGINIDVDPPVWNILKYITSVSRGINQLNRDIEMFTYYCPKTPVAVMGYSQVS